MDDFQIVVEGSSAANGAHRVEVKVRMRDGSLRPVSVQMWQGGCSPSALDLLGASVDDEVQSAILAHYGVQGLLVATEPQAESTV